MTFKWISHVIVTYPFPKADAFLTRLVKLGKSRGRIECQEPFVFELKKRLIDTSFFLAPKLAISHNQERLEWIEFTPKEPVEHLKNHVGKNCWVDGF